MPRRGTALEDTCAMLLLLPFAHAYTILCNGLQVVGTVPAAGATDVPIDARPALVFTDGCPTTTGFTVELTGPEGAVPGSFDASDLASTHLLELFPDAELAPDTDYTLSFGSETTERTTVAFRTGADRVEPLTGEPAVVTSELRWAAKNLNVQATIHAIPDPTGLSVLTVTDGVHGSNAFLAEADGPTDIDLSWAQATRPEETCLTIAQIDGAGRRTEGVSGDCEPVPLCATSPAAGALAAALGALAAVLRRARR